MVSNADNSATAVAYGANGSPQAGASISPQGTVSQSVQDNSNGSQTFTGVASVTGSQITTDIDTVNSAGVVQNQQSLNAGEFYVPTLNSDGTYNNEEIEANPQQTYNPYNNSIIYNFGNATLIVPPGSQVINTGASSGNYIPVGSEWIVNQPNGNGNATFTLNSSDKWNFSSTNQNTGVSIQTEIDSAVLPQQTSSDQVSGQGANVDQNGANVTLAPNASVNVNGGDNTFNFGTGASATLSPTGAGSSSVGADKLTWDGRKAGLALPKGQAAAEASTQTW